MEKKIRIYQVDAFTRERFKGNPAGVVANADGLTETQMQAIARELNNSETAFLLSPTGNDHEVWIRFFTPTTEVPICGHATIAAHYVRAVERRLPRSMVIHKTGAGLLPVEVVPAGDGYEIVMTQGQVEFGPELGHREKLLSALGLLPDDLDKRCPVQIVSTGHSKVLVGIKRKSTLNTLKPNMADLVQISKQIGCNGYFVFTLDSNENGVLTHARMFAPAIGIMEDPVTGNGNGPLGAYLVAHNLISHNGGELEFKAKQGEAIGRPGTMRVRVTIKHGLPVTVKIVGEAMIVFQANMEV